MSFLQEIGVSIFFLELYDPDKIPVLFIHGALGTPLEPYEQRVSRALNSILGEGVWTPPQRQWLERIGKQITQEVVVDREALDQGQFGAYGGFTRLNRVFDGKMQKVLEDFHEQVFAAYAAPGALLMLFCGPNDVRLWRKESPGTRG